MSWREVLGPTEIVGSGYPQNPQYPQNCSENQLFADCADFAEQDPKLKEALATVCRDLPITTAELYDVLAPADIDEWRHGNFDPDALKDFARLIVQRNDMDLGKVPDHYTKRAVCKHCGPVWLWFSGEVLGCPWCWNRVAGRPVPRPGPSA